MKRWPPACLAAMLAVATLSAQGGARRPGGQGPSMNAIAEQYVKLVLAVGQHDADYVDAFYGPAEWKADAERQKRPLAQIDADAERLIGQIPALSAADRRDPLVVFRREYPGHHVYNALLEQRLVRGRGWVEFSVYALFSPQSLIAEGTANYGIDVAFPADERIKFEREVLYPAAGLDASQAAQYGRIQALADRLAYAGNEAARTYLNGERDRAQTAAWLAQYAMTSPARAEQRTRFYDMYRSYVINYNLGKDLVKQFVESRDGVPTQPAKRWVEFVQLLASPRLPSGLR